MTWPMNNMNSSIKCYSLKSILAAGVICSMIFKLFIIVNPIIDFILQILLFCCCLPEIIIIRRIKVKNIVYLFVFIYIILITAFSSLYTPSSDSLRTLLKFSLIVLTCISAATFKYDEIKQVLDIFVLINCIYAILIISDKVPSLTQLTYLNYTLSLGGTCVILLSRIIYDRIRLRNIIVFLICLYALVQYPARGPVIFIILQIIVSCIFNKSKIRSLSVLLIATVCIFIFVFAIPQDSTYNLSYRILNMIESGSLEVGGRNTIYTTYIKKILESWFSGYGIGASEYLLSEVKHGGTYPHNYILQIWGELGLLAMLGIILCTIKLYLSFISKTIRSQISICHIELCYVLTYYEFQFLKSFDLLSSYPLWIFFIYMLKADTYKTNNKGIRINSIYLHPNV